MLTIAKLAHLNPTGGRHSLQNMLSGMRRAMAVAAERRANRPLQDIDDWSSHTEVAYYESCAVSRCV